MDVAPVVLAGLLIVVAIWAAVERVRERRRPAPVYIPVDETRSEVLAVAAGGSDRDRIRAVKVLRERTGLGLKEAYDTVRKWLAEEGDAWR